MPGASSEVFESITGRNLLENVLSVPEKIKKRFGNRSPNAFLCEIIFYVN